MGRDTASAAPGVNQILTRAALACRGARAGES